LVIVTPLSHMALLPPNMLLFSPFPTQTLCRSKRFWVFFALLANLGFALFPAPLFGAAFIPTSRDEVLEKLRPANDPVLVELRQLQRQLASQPQNLPLALHLAQRLIETGRSSGDPRYYGYAEASLRPWLSLPNPPPTILTLRATLRQNRHEFASALEDLSQVLGAAPDAVQARLTRATILTVQGDYSAARQDCAALEGQVLPIITAICRENLESLSGDAKGALDRLAKWDSPPSASEGEGGEAATPPDLSLWLYTTLAEIAVRLGDSAQAERYFRAGLAIDGQDVYLLASFADWLIAKGRAKEALGLMADPVPRADALLLRAAIAAQDSQADTAPMLVSTMRQRFAEANLRGDLRHLREEAIFALAIDKDPARALALAGQNWQSQREPFDAVIFLEAALASQDKKAAAPILRWVSERRLDDVRLVTLARALEAL
jgi:tetratricopeptide (TPR) repeat protein